MVTKLWWCKNDFSLKLNMKICKVFSELIDKVCKNYTKTLEGEWCKIIFSANTVDKDGMVEISLQYSFMHVLIPKMQLILKEFNTEKHEYTSTLSPSLIKLNAIASLKNINRKIIATDIKEKTF